MGSFGADELVVQGYRACHRCGEWLIDTKTTVAVCPDCRRTLKELSDRGRLRYEVEGRTFQTKIRSRKGHAKARKTPEYVAARKARDRANMAALQRLKHLYRPMYDMIYEEECIRQGVVLKGASRQTPRPRIVSQTLLQDILDAEERESEVAERLASGR